MYISNGLLSSKIPDLQHSMITWHYYLTLPYLFNVDKFCVTIVWTCTSSNRCEAILQQQQNKEDFIPFLQNSFNLSTVLVNLIKITCCFLVLSIELCSDVTFCCELILLIRTQRTQSLVRITILWAVTFKLSSL